MFLRDCLWLQLSPQMYSPGSSSNDSIQGELNGGAPAAAAQLALEGGRVQATFTQPGSLGMKFKVLKSNGGGERVRVESVKRGTAAATLDLLGPGLLLAMVDTVDVRARSYDEAIGLVKAAGRPVVLTFEQQGGGPMAVRFEQEGALGIKFATDSNGRLAVDSIREGTVAAAMPQLERGLVLLSLSSAVGTMSVVGLSKKEALAELKAASRPLELVFESDTHRPHPEIGVDLTAGVTATVAAASAVVERGERAEAAEIRSAAASAAGRADAAAVNAGMAAAGSPILHPEEQPYIDLHEAAAAGDQARVQMLLRQGADSAELDRSGGTAFHAACRSDHPFVAIDLLFGGCPREAADREGRTGAALCGEKVAAALSALDQLGAENHRFFSLSVPERWAQLKPRYNQRQLEAQELKQKTPESPLDKASPGTTELQQLMRGYEDDIDLPGRSLSPPHGRSVDWKALLPADLAEEEYAFGGSSFDEELSRAQVAPVSPSRSPVLVRSNSVHAQAVQGWLQQQGLPLEYTDAITVAFEQDGEAAGAPEEWVHVLESMQPEQVDQFIQSLSPDVSEAVPPEAGPAEGWVEYQDPTDGAPYFYHVQSGATAWERPSEMMRQQSGSYGHGSTAEPREVSLSEFSERCVVEEGDARDPVVRKLQTEKSALQEQVNALVAALAAQNKAGVTMASPKQERSMKEQLLGEKTSSLLRRARGCGVAEYTLEQALDSPEPRETLVTLLLDEQKAGRLALRVAPTEGVPPPSRAASGPDSTLDPFTNQGMAAAMSSSIGLEFAEASARAAEEFRGEMAKWREETDRRQAIALGKTPVKGGGSGVPRGGLLGAQARADDVLKQSPVLGLGLRMGRTADGVPLEQALAKIMASARLPSAGVPSFAGTNLESYSPARKTPVAAAAKASILDGSIGGAAGRKWRSPPPGSTARGLTIFQEHTSLLKAQLQDLQDSMAQPAAPWATTSSTINLDAVATPAPLAFTASLPKATPLPQPPAFRTSSERKDSGRTSPLVLTATANEHTWSTPAATAWTGVPGAGMDFSTRTIDWTPGKNLSVFGGSTPARPASASVAGVLLANGTRRTPGRVSPLSGVRGAALSAESGAMFGLSDPERVQRTGSLSPGDDT